MRSPGAEEQDKQGLTWKNGSQHVASIGRGLQCLADSLRTASRGVRRPPRLQRSHVAALRPRHRFGRSPRIRSSHPPVDRRRWPYSSCNLGCVLPEGRCSDCRPPGESPPRAVHEVAPSRRRSPLRRVAPVPGPTSRRPESRPGRRVPVASRTSAAGWTEPGGAPPLVRSNQRSHRASRRDVGSADLRRQARTSRPPPPS